MENEPAISMTLKEFEDRLSEERILGKWSVLPYVLMGAFGAFIADYLFF
jgi:hypothetical protein